MSLLKIGVYGPDPATVPKALGVLEARARRPIEVQAPGLGAGPGLESGPGEVGGWLESLADGEVDLALCPIDAVRDLLDERITIVGVPERGDPRDVLLGRVDEAMQLATWLRGAASRPTPPDRGACSGHTGRT